MNLANIVLKYMTFRIKGLMSVLIVIEDVSSGTSALMNSVVDRIVDILVFAIISSTC